MSERDRRTQELYAYHDGELSWWARRRVARRLAHDAAARRELETLSQIGALMREHAAGRTPPDLWERIREGLPYAPKPQAPPRREAIGGLGAPQWIAAGIAAAAIAAVLAVGIEPGHVPPGSLRWLD
jgi:anti-sigma factor RsiW